MANCNHGPLHAPIMGNTPVGICTKQHVEVAVIHSYHPILHTISTLLPSRYHIQSSSVVHHWSFFSIICHYHPLSCSQSSSVAVSPTSNSPNQEKALGVPFHHPWCVCCTSLALHYCYWHDSAPWVTAGGSWRLEGSSSSALGLLVALFHLPMPILGFVFCLVSTTVSCSYHHCPEYCRPPMGHCWRKLEVGGQFQQCLGTRLIHSSLLVIGMVVPRSSVRLSSCCSSASAVDCSPIIWFLASCYLLSSVVLVVICCSSSACRCNIIISCCFIICRCCIISAVIMSLI